MITSITLSLDIIFRGWEFAQTPWKSEIWYVSYHYRVYNELSDYECSCCLCPARDYGNYNIKYWWLYCNRMVIFLFSFLTSFLLTLNKKSSSMLWVDYFAWIIFVVSRKYFHLTFTIVILMYFPLALRHPKYTPKVKCPCITSEQIVGSSSKIRFYHILLIDSSHKYWLSWCINVIRPT